MPHHTDTSVGKLQVVQRGKKCLNFDLDRTCQKLLRTSTQDIRQWIVDLFGLTKRNNVGSLVHGVSLSLRGSGRLDTRLDTPPISCRHHPRSRIAPKFSAEILSDFPAKGCECQAIQPSEARG
jgi:hypothetical protein